MEENTNVSGLIDLRGCLMKQPEDNKTLELELTEKAEVEKRDLRTNEEFILDLINYSKHGALAQVFVIEAIRFYSKMVAESTPSEDKDKLSFISPQAWHDVGEDVYNQWKNKYEVKVNNEQPDD